nr:Rid family hydrolase [Hansschlegelia beijingensis]
MTDRGDARVRRLENLGMPWEKLFGYYQAVQYRDTIYLSGQLGHDDEGRIVGPAGLDDAGKVIDVSGMEQQIRQTYANASRLLERFGASLDDVVEETLFVLDMDEAFATAPQVRKEAYRTDMPRCASTLVATPRLAMPEQLVEITFRAVLGGGASS